MNHNRSAALERSVKKLLGGLNRFYGYPTSPPASIMALKVTKYVTNIIAEPKYKYGQQDQVTVRNHTTSIALERSV